MAPPELKSAFSVLFHRFTARITELMKVLKDLNAGKYERTMVSQQDKGRDERWFWFPSGSGCPEELLANSFCPCDADTVEKLSLVPGSGRIVNKDHIIKYG